MLRAPNHEQAYTSCSPCNPRCHKQLEELVVLTVAPAPPCWCPRRRRALAGGTPVVMMWARKRREASCPQGARQGRASRSRSIDTALGRPRPLAPLAPLQPHHSPLRRLRPLPVCHCRCGLQACGLQHWRAGCACFVYQISSSGDG